MTSTLPAPKQSIQSEDTTEVKFRKTVWENYFETLYPFQREVVRRVSDSNSIVVIPTGAGKTVIAAALAARKLANYPAAKIVFVVNRVPLVTQQAEVLRTVQGTSVACVYGERKDCNSWDDFCGSFNVLVIIDAVFSSWGMTNPSMWQRIGLLILDEVHHARGNSNYMKLLSTFHREKKFGYQQVLGLSASPVLISTPSEVSSALKVLENQSKCQIVTVTNTIQNLKDTIPSPAPFHLQFRPSRHEIAGTKKLNDLFTALEHIVRELLPTVYRGVNVGPGGFQFPAERCISALKQERGTFLLSTELSVVLSSVGSFPLAYIAVQLLQCINASLILLDDGATEAAFRHIQSACNSMKPVVENHCHGDVDGGGALLKHSSLSIVGGSLYKNGGSPQHQHDPKTHEFYTHLQQAIFDVFDLLQEIGEINQRDLCVSSGKMAALLALLEMHIGNVGSYDEDSFRCIVFCRTKATAQKVTQELGKLSFSKRVSPQYFVGHNATLLEDGTRIKMSDKEQQQRLAEFRSGTTKLLIATSVAEEGLDIPVCNLVVRFDSDFTALSYLQSRGRARKVGSSFYTITKAGEGEGHINRITNCIAAIDDEVQKMQDYRDQGHTFY